MTHVELRKLYLNTATLEFVWPVGTNRQPKSLLMVKNLTTGAPEAWSLDLFLQEHKLMEPSYKEVQHKRAA